MFKPRLPDWLERIRDEYFKWASNKERYFALYPISTKFIEHLLKNKGKFYGFTKKYNSKRSYTPHKRQKIKRGPLSTKD